MRLGDVVDGRRQAGADRPDRLVGDDDRRRALRPPAPSRRSGATGCRASRRSRARRASRRCRRWRSARPATPPPPWPGRCVGLAMVGAPLGMADDDVRGAGILQHLGGNVAGMGAAFLPVAVLAAALDRRARQHFGARDSSVAGTQTSASVSASSPPMKPWPIASSSWSEALVPFIFQLPATSGRMAEVIGRRPSRHRGRRRVHYQNRATKQSTVARKGAIAHRLPSGATRKNADARNRNETCSTHFEGRRYLGRQTLAVHAGHQLRDLGHLRPDDRRLRLVACHQGRRHHGVAQGLPPRLRPADADACRSSSARG